MAGTPVDAEAGKGKDSTGGGGLGGIAESMTAMTNITKGLSGVVDGIFQVIGKLFNAIMDASPLLSGVLKIVDKMFRLILMPIGNMIARLLLPMAINMAKKTMAFLSKYGNAGPEKIGDALTEGLTMALESIVDMLSVVMTKVLWPVLTALGQAIVNGIAYVLSGGLLGSNKAVAEYAPGEDYGNMIQKDVTDLLGIAGTGFGNAVDQFGLTLQTGNRIAGNSFSELATAFYYGSSDIANGFQSVHDVLIIGTTKAIEKFGDTFNLSGAGMVTVINTVTESFKKLIPHVEAAITTFVENSGNNAQTTTTGPETAPHKMEGGAWAQIYILEHMQMEHPEWGYDAKTKQFVKKMARGGIITHPTNILAGEAGPEAIIPLNKSGAVGGQTIHVHFHGDIYGMDDFERQVQAIVGKYSGRVRGAI
jgi:hypothetical protein